MLHVRQFIIVSALFIVSSICYPQENRITTLDSVGVVAYWHGIEYRPMHEMAMKDRVWIQEGFKSGTSQIGVSQVWGGGKFQPSQGMDKLKQFRFETEGNTRWNKTDFWGKFAYQRDREDSTALRHQTRWNEDAPYYYASIRKNMYSRETYKLDAAIQQQFIDGQLPVTLGLDYRLGSHYSNNDPRGDISDMNLTINLAVGHRVQQLTYHLHGIIGYGSERVGVGYKNDKNNSGLERPEYTNWIMEGYGTMNSKTSNIRYEGFVNRRGAGVNLKYETGNNGSVFFNGRYVRENQSFKETNSTPSTYQILMDYNKDIVMGELLWTSPLQQHHVFTISLDGRIERGADGLYSLGGATGQNNYVYQRDQVWAKANYSFAKSTLNANIGINDLNREDGKAGNKLTYTQVKLGLGYSHSFPLKKIFVLRSELNYAFQHALNHNLVMPLINESDVARRIIHHDYLYQSASVHEWNTRWTFSDNRPRRNWSVNVQVDYQRRGEFESQELSSIYQPGKDWFIGKLGLSYAF